MTLMWFGPLEPKWKVLVFLLVFISWALRFVPSAFPQHVSLVRVRTKPPKMKFPGVVLWGVFASPHGFTQPWPALRTLNAQYGGGRRAESMR